MESFSQAFLLRTTAIWSDFNLLFFPCKYEGRPWMASLHIVFFLGDKIGQSHAVTITYILDIGYRPRAFARKRMVIV